MVRKIITAGAAAALILGSAMPVLAYGRHHRSNPDVEMIGVISDNNVVAVANTGVNDQYGGKMQFMKTGDAFAGAYQSNTVNSFDCNCLPRKADVELKGFVKDNNVIAVANTGLNDQYGAVSHSRHHHSSGSMQFMTTGDAWAEAYQWNVINSSVTPSQAD